MYWHCGTLLGRHLPTGKFNLGKIFFNQATLHKVDEWLTDIWSSSSDEFDKSDLRKHVGKPLDHIPGWLEHILKFNEKDLEPHWTETQTAISISRSKWSFSSEPGSVEPASWVSAIILFTLFKIHGLKPLTAERFVDTIKYTHADFPLRKTPAFSNTPPSNLFHEALKRSGHTCWSERSYGPNSLTNLYFSAYSLLLDTSDVPVVGCEEGKHRTKCTACHAKCAFHDLSSVLDEELLGHPLQSLLEKDKKERVKRLITKLNYPRSQKKLDLRYAPPLNQVDLMTLTKKLSSLSNLFQYALDNVQDMGLLNEGGKISLGFTNSANAYLEDKDEDEEEEDTEALDIEDPEEEEDTQASSPSMPEPESSAQLPEPVSNHENDTLNFEHLENLAQPFHSVSGDNSSYAYHNNHPNFSATQVPQTQDVVSDEILEIVDS
ncbi:hypothetical protein K435DRAFT_357187 [Dendrothele bispora CBS 962.96]|uniref:Uncharacterized protein n=1 Tax=Dendrothele bispora (strain CBS 962.96) TaxID=1314807 RepID=A0A4S8LDZ9_DENBC|nr:hypothetical protein K435DRAFT_357187 [Dendrothele bispora CBS 962.96]